MKLCSTVTVYTSSTASPPQVQLEPGSWPLPLPTKVGKGSGGSAVCCPAVEPDDANSSSSPCICRVSFGSPIQVPSAAPAHQAPSFWRLLSSSLLPLYCRHLHKDHHSTCINLNHYYCATGAGGGPKNQGFGLFRQGFAVQPEHLNQP